MIDIMKFFRSIYIYISSKIRFPNSSYDSVNKFDKDSNNYFDDDDDNLSEKDSKLYDNDNDYEKYEINDTHIYDEEYEIMISNIHTFNNSR
jgi:hypothetical protein